MINEIVNFLVNSIFELGYFGIFILMAIQNSIFPFAMELVLVPAGYLAYKGEMSLGLVLFFGSMGQLAGALCSYWFAYYFGKKVVYRFVNKKIQLKLQNIFRENNLNSLFFAFIIPGIRPYISLPAGFSKMNLFKFVLFVFIGSFFWVSLVSLVGYFVGEDAVLIKQYMDWVTFVTILIGVGWFLWYAKHKSTNNVV